MNENGNVQVDLFAVVGRLTVENGMLRDRVTMLENELRRVTMPPPPLVEDELSPLPE